MRDDQEQDVRVMMTDQDVIILSHGGCNLQSGDVYIVTRLILGRGKGCQLYLLHHPCLMK